MGIKWIRAHNSSNAGFHLAATTQNTLRSIFSLGDADDRGAFRGCKNSRDVDRRRKKRSFDTEDKRGSASQDPIEICSSAS